THAPAWVPDSQRTAATGERLLASFDWSGLTHGRYDVPTGAVHALRQHDDLNSGKHPHLADEIAERGIEQPLEVRLHGDGRVVLRGGSHRVNIAHSLGHPTVPVQVVDMRTRHTAAAASPDGMREDWHPGDRAHYEYHCYEAHDSSDAELWYRSHQQVHVLGRGEDEDLDAPLHERLEEGMPRVYQGRFGDGHEGDATEDELLTHPRHFTRPDPPARPKTAKVWAPNQGIFGPTTGLDTRLFAGEELRPEVRRDLMERLDRALRVDTQLVGSEWQDYLRVYIAGGSASEWAGGRPNETAQDLDVLIGVDYQAARGHAFAGMDDEQIDAALNAALRAQFNATGWQPGFGGTWDLTGYVNHAAYDIRDIKPYAAYDVSDMRWAVKPPHLPGHSAQDFHPALLAEARAVAAQARAILRLPEPLRTREALSLWEKIHADRKRAFSIEGEGWEDPGNLIEKWLAYAPGGILGKIRQLVFAQQKTAALKGPLEPVS